MATATIHEVPAASIAEARLSVAIHEAGHAVVGHALGVKFGKRGITVVPSKPDKNLLGCVYPVGRRKHSDLTEIAFSLAGGMAQYRVDRSCCPSHWAGDIDDII